MQQVKDFSYELSELQVRIFKDPLNYDLEYNEVMDTYKKMVLLAKVPHKHLNLILSFLVSVNVHYSNQLGDLIIGQLNRLGSTSVPCTKVLLKHLKALKTHGRVDEVSFFKTMFEYEGSFSFYRMQAVADDLLQYFIGLIEKGTDNQVSYCMVYLCYFYEKGLINDDVFVSTLLSALRGRRIAARRICSHFILNEFRPSDKVERGHIQVHEQESAASDVPAIVEILGRDTASDLARDLFKIVKGEKDIDIKLVHVIGKLIRYHELNVKGFCVHIMDRTHFSKDNFKKIMGVVAECVRFSSKNSCVINYILENLCNESKDEDFICYGFNLLKIILLNSMDENYNYKTNVDEEMVSATVDILSVFEKTRSKSVRYAHSMFLNVYKKKGDNGKDLDFICRKKSKIEKLAALRIARKPSQKEKHKRKKNMRKQLLKHKFNNQK